MLLPEGRGVLAGRDGVGLIGVGCVSDVDGDGCEDIVIGGGITLEGEDRGSLGVGSGAKGTRGEGSSKVVIAAEVVLVENGAQVVSDLYEVLEGVGIAEIGSEDGC